MADKFFDSGAMAHLKRGLDAYTLRQKVIAENIAQAETPGYTSRAVEFEALLREAEGTGGNGLAMKRRSGGHIPAPSAGLPVPKLLETSPRAANNGVNDVNLDLEMAALAENSLSHKMVSRILAARYQALKSAIRGSA